MKCADDVVHFMDTFDVVATHPPVARDAASASSNASTISILQEIVAQSEVPPKDAVGCTDLPPLRLDPTFQRAYNQLLDVLKHPDAADLVHSIQGFVKSMHEASSRKSSNPSNGGEKVHNFIAHFLHLMQLSPLIKKLEQQEALPDLRDQGMRRETLEAFLMEKLHGAVFGARPQEDANLSARIASLGFLSFQHLDITATSDLARWTLIQARLMELPRYLSPRRQMACILQVCHDLTHLLKDHLGGKYPGADEFLPALIYTILKANPPHLHSTVEYIQTYRHPSKLLSEPGYFFTHLVSSLSFLDHLDDSGLSISAEEFHDGLKASTRDLHAAMPSTGRIDASDSAAQDTDSCPNDCSLDTAPHSVLDVWNRRRKAIATHTSPLFTFRLPSVDVPTTATDSFMTATPNDLRLTDVPDLLAQYKLLHVICQQHGFVQPKNI
ncbi:hypothetical protein DYB32_003888 [Aphanomyces invadans]|uniref:VPS9 domain-containing protein n=1 Tax=Aphanomyces invadans TaxID=157072 RepID=A0A418AZ62_9STRA|nr:hypothetical protein DYB32_003888 [Aphanomyces invadans]